MELADRVIKLRKELGLTQEELAKKMGYKSRVSINKIENGRPISQKIIVRLAEVLNTTPAYLMGWEEEKEDESVIIGRNIKSIRTEKNISLLELAEEIHIDLDTLIQYEKGIRKIPLDILKKFAIYFDTTIDNLMGFELETERRHVVITDNTVLNERYKKWQEAIGYNHFTDEEIDKLIDYAKYLISQRKDEKE